MNVEIEAKEEAVSEQLRLDNADRAGTLRVPASLLSAYDFFATLVDHPNTMSLLASDTRPGTTVSWRPHDHENRTQLMDCDLSFHNIRMRWPGKHE